MGRNKQVRQLKKYTFIALAIIAVIAVSGGVYVKTRPEQSNVPEVAGASTIQYQDPTTGLTVSYTEGVKFSTRDKPEIFSITNNQPAFSVVAQYEEGDSIRKLKTLGTDIRETVTDNVKKQLPDTYKDAEVLEERVYEQNGSRVAEIKFKYVNENGGSITQRLVIIFKNDSLVSTVSAQAPTSEFESTNQKYLTPILNSLKY